MPELSYRCPRCQGTLETYAERYECRSCVAVYPIIAGIPDFRIYADPYIGIEADREKGRYLANEAKRLTFAELVERYYAITPEVTPDQARRFHAHHLAGTTRGQGMLERMAAYGLTRKSSTDGPWLDLGCGTGGFLAAAVTSHSVVGVDIAFRWLIVGKQRLAELGCGDIPLICACADFLPFPDRSFTAIIAENVIEHTRDAEAVLAEIARVRHADGVVMARTVNRYALAPEPHVGVWGVGFLPRQAMNRYVQWRKGIPYEHIRLESYPSLRRAVRSAGSSGWRVQPPLLTHSDYQHHAAVQQRLFSWYARLGELLPPARPMLGFFGPYLDIVSQPGK